MVFKNHQTETEEQYFYATDNFEGTEAQWDVSPLIFAQTHPNPSLVKKDINAALKSVKTIDGQDGYICGAVVESKVIIPGQPRLSANIVFDDPKLETMYNEGKLALSSAFFCPNEPDGRLNGKVEPNHVLVFVQDDNNQPRDLGSGWWHNKAEDGNVVNQKMHGGPGSGRYLAGSGEGNSKIAGTLKSPASEEYIENAKEDMRATGTVVNEAGYSNDAGDQAFAEMESAFDELDASWESFGMEDTARNVGGAVALALASDDLGGEIDNETVIGLRDNLARIFSAAIQEKANQTGHSDDVIFGATAKSYFIKGFNETLPDVTGDNQMENKSDLEKFKSFVNKLWHKLTGDVDDSSRIDDERPPVNDQPIHSHGDGGDGMDPTIQKKIEELDAKVTALQNERDALAKTNKALEDEKANLSKVIDGIALEKEDKAWANLRDTKIPRGWLVGDKAEDTQKSEYKKDPVAYLNKIIEAKREDPKGEVGMPFTNQNDDSDDTAKMNTLLVKSNIPGRLH